MTKTLEWCDCRWCADEHPGGMILFVTVPSFKYVVKHTKTIVRHIGTDEDGNTLTEEHEFAAPELGQANIDRHTFGRLLIPPGGLDGRDIDDIVERRVPWACDNGSFNVFDQPKFEAMMDNLAHHPYCHFVAAPDVVWNKFEPHERHLSAIATIEKFLEWQPYIKERGLPAAMVGQDGLEQYEIPWELMDAYFVGGSDAWKTSAASEHIIREAQSRGMWVHVGRVSGDQRIRWCHTVGAASFDGSAFGRFRDASDKRDGLGRLQGGLINAAAPRHGRLFVTDLEGNHLEEEQG